MNEYRSSDRIKASDSRGAEKSNPNDLLQVGRVSPNNGRAVSRALRLQVSPLVQRNFGLSSSIQHDDEGSTDRCNGDSDKSCPLHSRCTQKGCAVCPAYTDKCKRFLEGKIQYSPIVKPIPEVNIHGYKYYWTQASWGSQPLHSWKSGRQQLEIYSSINFDSGRDGRDGPETDLACVGTFIGSTSKECMGS